MRWWIAVILGDLERGEWRGAFLHWDLKGRGASERLRMVISQSSSKA